MHRFVSMKQSCDCARLRVRAPACRRISNHSGPHDLFAMRSVVELREHVSRRAETLGHWRLRWRAVFARGSRLPQWPSRAVHRARLHQHRTRRAQALRSTVDPGCGDSNTNLEALPPLWRMLLRNRTLLEVSHARVSEVRADSAIAVAFPVRHSRPRALRRAESPPGAELGPNRAPHRPPGRCAPCRHITELSTRS